MAVKGSAFILAMLLGGSSVAALPAAACAAAGPRTAPGAPRGLVVVLMLEVEDQVTRNAMARITGELAAAPFTVVTERLDPASDVMLQVEAAGRALDPLATFAIAREGGDLSGDVAVWVSNRITQTTTVRRMPIRVGDVDGATAHLAIEAVELVRASLAGLWPGAGPPAVPVVEALRPPVRPGRRLRVGVGTSLCADFESAPAFWSPKVAITYGRPDATSMRLSLTGLGPGADVAAPDGAGGARLERAAVDVGLVSPFRAGRTFEPILSIAAGVQLLTAQGTGAPAARLRRELSWSALAAVGGGGLLALGAHLALAAEAQLLFVSPSTVVRVGDTAVARFDRLAFSTEVGLLASF